VPFLPTESSAGGLAGQSLFGTLLRLQAKPQMSMAIPLAVKNAPGGAQAFSSQDIVGAVRRISLTDFLALMIDSLGPVHGLVEVGHGLIAKVQDRSFLAPVTGAWGKYLADSARSVDAVWSGLMRSDLAAVAEAGDRILETRHRAGQGREQIFEDYLSPYELRLGSGRGARGPTLIRQIAQFGRLLVAWPGLVAAVADLGKNGVRLGVYT
jgi:hypothetical protein